MNYEKLSKKKLIELIRECKRREWEYLEGTEKDYNKFLLDDFSKRQEELELRNEQMADIQQQLEESREKYVELYDNAPVGYLTLNNKGLIKDINITGSNLLGYDISRLKEYPFNLFIAREYSLEFLKYLIECRQSRQRKDTSIKLKNDKFVQVVTTPEKVRGKTFFKMILNDITEIKKAEDLNAFHASIVEHSEDAIYTRTTEGEITSWNKAAAKMYGYEASEIIGKHTSIIYPEDHKEDYYKINEMILKEGYLDQYRTINLTNKGKVITVSASFSLLSINENNSGNIVAIVRDISAQAAYEEKLNKSLQEKELLLKEIHHRVKNNLQIISSLLNLQKAKINNEEVRESFLSSQNRIRAMAMVHEKLYLSGNSAKININEYVTELCRFLYLSYPMTEKFIKLNQNVESELVDIDLAIDIGLLLNELITNALKHAFNNLREGEINLSIAMSDKKVEINFSDNGLGIDPHIIETNDSLGFTIIKSLVEQNNGSLNINKNKGTEFLITLIR